MNKLTKNQVILIHQKIIQLTGGKTGIRDEGLLESALASPFITFAGIELYPTLEEKAARLGYGLIQNHAMFDGNKRLAIHCMLLFLLINNVKLSYTLKEAETIVLKLAKHEASQNDLVDWIHTHKK